MLMMMKRLAQMQEPVQEQTPPEESQAEKILRWALELPASRPQLETEAAHLEGLLDNLQAPVSEQGGQLMAQLVEVMEGQLDGIYGLLDGDEEVFQNCLTLLVECDEQLRELEGQLVCLREQVPLVA